MNTANYSIKRGDSNGETFVDYTTEISEGMVVLDPVHRIQATQVESRDALFP